MKKILFISFILIIIACSTEWTYTPINVIYNDYKLAFKDDLNVVRKQYKKQELQPELLLTELAQQKANEMDSLKDCNHNGFYKRVILSKAKYVGECVSVNYSTPQQEIIGYLGSADHRKIVLNPSFTYFGYGKSGIYTCVILANYK